jgi:NitT/TauT family transport system ATP-binding protein
VTSPILQLPSYLELTDGVRARFEKIESREVVLEVDGLGKRFSQEGPAALENVSFKVHRREFICVIGPSGCGKSTLIRLLAGLEPATSGGIKVKGRPVEGPGADRGMVFQEYTLFPWLTLKGNVMFGPRITERGAGDPDAEALQWLEMVGLGDRADAYPHELSGGMKQRVAIARALANYPDILLMDEPFGALDAQTRCKMQEHLLQIWKNVDVTVVFITHDLDEAIYLADRILVLDARPGRIREFIKVPVERPRTVDQMLSPHFLAVKKRVDELIHNHEPAKALPVVRMARAGDDVE